MLATLLGTKPSASCIPAGKSQLQLEGASGPQTKPTPLGTQLSPALGTVPRGGSAHFTL